jgi:hypothetical protein
METIRDPSRRGLRPGKEPGFHLQIPEMDNRLILLEKARRLIYLESKRKAFRLYGMLLECTHRRSKTSRYAR